MLQCQSYSVGSLTTHQSWRRTSGATQEEISTLVDSRGGDGRVMTFEDGRLLVTDAKLDQDSGTYSCVASNVYGTSTATSHVTVLSKSHCTGMGVWLDQSKNFISA